MKDWGVLDESDRAFIVAGGLAGRIPMDVYEDLVRSWGGVDVWGSREDGVLSVREALRGVRVARGVLEGVLESSGRSGGVLEKRDRWRFMARCLSVLDHGAQVRFLSGFDVRGCSRELYMLGGLLRRAKRESGRFPRDQSCAMDDVWRRIRDHAVLSIWCPITDVEWRVVAEVVLAGGHHGDLAKALGPGWRRQFSGDGEVVEFCGMVLRLFRKDRRLMRALLRQPVGDHLYAERWVRVNVINRWLRVFDREITRFALRTPPEIEIDPPMRDAFYHWMRFMDLMQGEMLANRTGKDFKAAAAKSAESAEAVSTVSAVSNEVAA